MTLRGLMSQSLEKLIIDFGVHASRDLETRSRGSRCAPFVCLSICLSIVKPAPLQKFGWVFEYHGSLFYFTSMAVKALLQLGG